MKEISVTTASFRKFCQGIGSMIVAWEAFLQELQEYLRLPCVLRDVGRSGVLNCSPTFTKREQPRHRRRNDASNYLKKLARPVGFEPATTSLEGWGSLQLSYRRNLYGLSGARPNPPRPAGASVIRPHSSPSPSSPWPARLKKDRILRGPSALCGARTCRWFAPLPIHGFPARIPRFSPSYAGFFLH